MATEFRIDRDRLIEAVGLKNKNRGVGWVGEGMEEDGVKNGPNSGDKALLLVFCQRVVFRGNE